MSKKPNPELIDEENPEWTAKQIAKARPASEVLPKIFGEQVAQKMLKPGGLKSRLVVAGDGTSAGYAEIHSGIVELLSSARVTAARSVNALMTASYWEIGRRIVEAEQKGKRRAGYGEQLIERLSLDLTRHFGRGFSSQNLWQMRQFFLAWGLDETLQTVSGDSAILQTPSGEFNTSHAATKPSRQLTLPELSNAFALPWSAYVRLLSVKDTHARQFYETEAIRGGWSVRQLDRQIGSQFYERLRPAMRGRKRCRAMLSAPVSSLTASTLRDLKNGGSLEADHIVGFMLKKARMHGADERMLAAA